jgi:hypothetical protein
MAASFVVRWTGWHLAGPGVIVRLVPGPPSSGQGVRVRARAPRSGRPSPQSRSPPAHADASFHDLGLPVRTDLRDRAGYCGLFRTPSLRNVALRRSFFHNGVFHTLDEALRFYARRDTHPHEFYPRAADGTARPPAKAWVRATGLSG